HELAARALVLQALALVRVVDVACALARGDARLVELRALREEARTRARELGALLLEALARRRELAGERRVGTLARGGELGGMLRAHGLGVALEARTLLGERVR